MKDRNFHRQDTGYKKNKNGGKGMLEDISAQVFVLDNIDQLFIYIFFVNRHIFLLHVRCIERYILEKFLQDGMESSCADVLRLFIYDCGLGCDFFYGVIRELDIQTFCPDQCDVLFDQGVSGFQKDPEKFIFA